MRPLSPPLLARSLAQMNAAGATHAVVEVSSRELSQQVLAGVTLDAVCITHVGGDHLDWHGSVENYRQAKRRIFEYLHPDGVAILNADDPASVEMLSDLNQPALTFGMQQPAEITAEIIEQHVNEQMFVLSAGDDSVGVRTAMIGDHHVYNCLAAAATALAYGIELPDDRPRPGSGGPAAGPHGTRHVRPGICGVGRRGRFARCVARLPASRAASTTSGRLICVFGAHDECDPTRLPAMGRVIGAMADVAVVTNNDRPRRLAPLLHGSAERLCRAAQGPRHRRSRRGNCLRH